MTVSRGFIRKKIPPTAWWTKQRPFPASAQRRRTGCPRAVTRSTDARCTRLPRSRARACGAGPIPLLFPVSQPRAASTGTRSRRAELNRTRRTHTHARDVGQPRHLHQGTGSRGQSRAATAGAWRCGRLVEARRRCFRMRRGGARSQATSDDDDDQNVTATQRLNTRRPCSRRPLWSSVWVGGRAAASGSALPVSPHCPSCSSLVG